MTNQEINERIAKLCGWKPTTDGGICWDSNGNAIITYPNYAESLDACREFEYVLNGYNARSYINRLCELCAPAPNGIYGYFSVVTATPLQRCEAFLRLKGQWE